MGDTQQPMLRLRSVHWQVQFGLSLARTDTVQVNELIDRSATSTVAMSETKEASL